LRGKVLEAAKHMAAAVSPCRDYTSCSRKTCGHLGHGIVPNNSLGFRNKARLIVSRVLPMHGPSQRGSVRQHPAGSDYRVGESDVPVSEWCTRKRTETI
jgi:hypothetical protein